MDGISVDLLVDYIVTMQYKSTTAMVRVDKRTMDHIQVIDLKSGRFYGKSVYPNLMNPLASAVEEGDVSKIQVALANIFYIPPDNILVLPLSDLFG